MDTDSMVHELLAIESVRRLTANYSHGLDKRDGALFASIWTQDAEWESNPGGPHSCGHVEIMAAVEQVWSAVPETHHWNCNHSIDVDIASGTATGLCDATSVALFADGRWMRTAITYRDKYTCEGDTWLISQRLCEVHHQLEIAKPESSAP